MKQTDYHYKVVLIGDSGVGKSNIISRFTKNQFNSESKTTIGVQFAAKTFQVDGKVIKLQIWDTAGQERYRSMASNYYRGALGAMLVYDLTRATSFENLQKWIKELKNYANENIVYVLAGNKCDLKQYRTIKTEHGQQYAKDNNMAFFETSAKDGSGVEKAFTHMIEEILNRQKQAPKKNLTTGPGFEREALQIQKKSQPKKNCCR